MNFLTHFLKVRKGQILPFFMLIRPENRHIPAANFASDTIFRPFFGQPSHVLTEIICRFHPDHTSETAPDRPLPAHKNHQKARRTAHHPAALQTGCTGLLEPAQRNLIDNVIPTPSFDEVYRKNLISLGETVEDKGHPLGQPDQELQHGAGTPVARGSLRTIPVHELNSLLQSVIGSVCVRFDDLRTKYQLVQFLGQPQIPALFRNPDASAQPLEIWIVNVLI